MKQRIVAFGIVVTAATWALSGYGLVSEHRNTLKHAQEDALNLTRAFAQSTTQTFLAIDRVLQQAAELYQQNQKNPPLAALSRSVSLDRGMAIDLAITDAQGAVIQSSDPARLGKPIAGLMRPAFGVSDARDMAIIGRPTAGSDATVVFHIARHIYDRNKGRTGMVVASVNVDDLSNAYRAADVGRDGFVALVGTDGVARARAPFIPGLLKRAAPQTSLLPIAKRSEGCRMGRSPLDAVERLTCFHTIGDRPLVVMVGFGKDEIFEDYRDARTRYLLAAAAITLIMIVMSAWLVRREHTLTRTSRALQESEHRSAQKSDILEVTLENMSQGIFLVEADSRIAVINRRAQEMLDLPDSLINDELTIEKLVRNLWDRGEYGTDGAAIDSQLRDFILAGGLHNSPPVYTRKRPNGTVLEIRTVMLPNGGAVRTLTDITEHQQTEEQLEAAKQAAESGYRSKSAFLATMSHEIRTPLNGIIGMASLLLESRLEPDHRKSVETIQECSEALLELINDILDFSKFEVGRVDLEMHPFNVIEICESVFNIIAPRARAKNLTLVFAPLRNLPGRIESDSARLRQVLVNLLGNAVKFTESGAVILRVFPVGNPEAPRVRFEVEDTGIGISEEARKRLFAEFTQVEASINRRFGGTGLGLAICKKIITAMDGCIGADATADKGSLFWFEVPLRACETGPAASHPAPPPDLKVALIADDDPGRRAIADMLRELGIPVTASDRPDAIGGANVALVSIQHSLAIDLIVGKMPASVERVRCLGYGFGSLALSGHGLAMIEGAVTPSSLRQALIGDAQDDGAQAPARRPIEQAKRSAVSLSILLAEDNAVNQRIAATMLGNMGHSVDIVANGLDAVTAADANAYDVILMDMQMPKMDGLEATRAIRAHNGASSQVPIIAMTANAFASDRDACLAAGMNDFISKPITARKLFDSIEPWADGISVVRAPSPQAHVEAQPEPQPDPVSVPEHPKPAPRISAGTPARPGAAKTARETTDDRALIDLQQMHLIREELGADGVCELLVSFWSEARNLLTELEEALTTSDTHQADVVLHTLKGSASNLGLAGCGAICDQIRTDISNGRTPDINPLLTIMFKTLQATQPYIAGDKDAERSAA